MRDLVQLLLLGSIRRNLHAHDVLSEGLPLGSHLFQSCQLHPLSTRAIPIIVTSVSLASRGLESKCAYAHILVLMGAGVISRGVKLIV